MKFIACAFVLVIMSATAYAADIDGTWTGTVAAPTGDVAVTFNMKADGAKLTGTTLGLDGTTVPLQNGKIDGSAITFSVSFDFGGTPFDISYKGVVASDRIKMTADAAGMPLEFVLMKSKEVAAPEGTLDGKPAEGKTIDGKWTGAIAGPLGEIPVTFNFKSDGAKLTGTMLGLDGAPVPLKDGKVDGSAIAFGVTLNLAGIPLEMACKGAVSSDRIKLSAEVAGMPIDVVLKKANP